MSNKPKKREPLRRSPSVAKRNKSASETPKKGGTKLDFQDPHHVTAQRNSLELAIGHEVRDFRRKLNMTVAELATMAGMSTGMLSKIENGQTSPSLATLQELSKALQVPVTAFFRKFEEEKDATYVKAGQGLTDRAPRHARRTPVPAARPFAEP